MFHSFFSGDNPIFRFTSWALDILVLSLLWLVCCLPIVTIGPATAALYYSCVKCVRYHEDAPYGSFFSAFRQNLKTGAVATLIFLVLGEALLLIYLFLLAQAETGTPPWPLLRVVYLVLMLLPLAVLFCAFPLLSRFDSTVGGLFAASLRMTLRHLPFMLALAVLDTALLLITVRYLFYGAMVVTPAIGALLSSYLLEPVFRKYTPDDGTSGEDEDSEKPWYLR